MVGGVVRDHVNGVEQKQQHVSGVEVVGARSPDDDQYLGVTLTSVHERMDGEVDDQVGVKRVLDDWDENGQHCPAGVTLTNVHHLIY